MSTVRTCIRKVTKFLDHISDDGTFHVAKRRGGHQRLVALYGGQKRSFIVPSPSTTNVYEKKMEHEVNRFAYSVNLLVRPTYTHTHQEKGKSF